MSNRELPMMPWFPQDFASATAHWAFAERGAYRTLLDAQWTLGGLPDDEQRLARIVGMTADEFAEVWPMVSTKFELVNGQLQNKRLEEHRVEALRLKQSRARGAHTANAKRGAHIKESERSAPQPAVAKHSGERDAERTHPSPSPSPSGEEIHTQRAREALTPTQQADEAEHHVMFERVRKAYPPFAGRQNWIHVEAYCRNLIAEGSSWNALIAAVKRYAAYVKGGGCSSTAFVLSPEKFFSAGDDPWKQEWALPQKIAKPVTGWRPDPADDPPLEAGHA